MIGTSQSRKSYCRVIEPLESRTYFSVDLTDSVSVVSPASLQVKPGHSGAVSVVVLNNGSTTATGPLRISIGISANANGSSPIQTVQATRKIHLVAGNFAVFRLSSKIPAKFTPGTYFASATIDANNSFKETNVGNNFAVSLNSLTVLSPFPNLLGTWSGPAKITKGVDKGLVVTQLITYTSENSATGAFTATGTNFFPSGATTAFTFQGTINAKGAIVDSGSDVPLDDTGVFHAKGKLTGNLIRATFVNAISSGSSTATRVA